MAPHLTCDLEQLGSLFGAGSFICGLPPPADCPGWRRPVPGAPLHQVGSGGLCHDSVGLSPVRTTCGQTTLPGASSLLSGSARSGLAHPGSERSTRLGFAVYSGSLTVPRC